KTSTTLFENIQTVFFFIAPPFAVVFEFGILWRRANGVAAVVPILLGFLFTLVVRPFEFLGRFHTLYHSALFACLFFTLVMISTSLLTSPPPKEKTEGIIWNKSFLSLPPEEAQKYRGLKDWRIWWALFVGTVLAIYGWFLWHRIRNPW